MVKNMKTSWFIASGTLYSNESDYHKGLFGVRTTGCTCCSMEYELTKDELLTLLKDMIEVLKRRIILLKNNVKM